MMLDALAQVQDLNSADLGKWLAAFLVLAPLLGLGGFMFGRRHKVDVSMEDTFVTRREFDSFKSDIRDDVREMKGLWANAIAKIEKRDEQLTADIRSVAKTAYEGRKSLHTKTNDQHARLKSMEDRFAQLGG